MDRDHYRRIAGSFPTGVTIVTACEADGTPMGLTTQSFVGLSTEPPMMMVAIDKSSRTLGALLSAKAFVINFLKIGSEDLSTLFASKGDDKFEGLSWMPSAVASGAPILRDMIVAYAECVVVQTVEAGDHWIFIAQVAGGDVLDGVPLLYYRRTYAGWPLETPAPEVR